jgi:hypothetical protein
MKSRLPGGRLFLSFMMLRYCCGCLLGGYLEIRHLTVKFEVQVNILLIDGLSRVAE